MNNLEFVAKLKDIADNYKTSYMLGAWGHFTSDAMINSSVSRTDVNNAPYKAGAVSIKNQGWMFDCVCLIKAVLWGWTGDKSKPLGGGAKYGSNGVPDIGANTIITKCKDISTDFSKIEIGELVWMTGHVGVYVGNNKVIECTPRWSVSPGVKYTNLANNGATANPSRTWTKHGKLPYIEYVDSNKETLSEDMKWAVDNGLIFGYGNGKYGENDALTRGQLAIVLKRFYDLINKVG